MIMLLILAAIIVGGVKGYNYFKKKDVVAAASYTTAKAAKATIQNVLSGTGTIEPLNQYNVTSLVSGEVLKASFEEGDEVKKGQVLYKISTKEVEKTLKTAKLSVQKAQKAYDKAVKEKDKLVVTTNKTGQIKELYVEVGDTIKAGTTIADIYDNSTMILEVPFNSASVKSSLVGKSATVELTNSMETVKGTVSEISSIEEALDGNMVVKYVTIKVKNPGTIAAGQTATATIGNLACNSAGTFAVNTQATITATNDGTIKSLSVKKGSQVSKGDNLLSLSSETVETQIENCKDALNEAQISLDNQSETLDDYTITAPISGQVITKNTKKGDTLDSKNSTEALAVIYDMSALTFDMSIDELDIKGVEEGQSVEVTIDALDSKVMSATVDKVSISGTTSNGVTTYPVTVKMDDTTDLLPGMNVTGEIIIEEAKDVISIPVSGVQRGDIVYVQGEDPNKDSDEQQNETTSESPKGRTGAGNKVPDGFYTVEATTGINDGTNIAILSGISEGDVIYIPVTQTTTVKETDSNNDAMEMPGGSSMGGGQMPSGGGGGAPSGGRPSR